MNRSKRRQNWDANKYSLSPFVGRRQRPSDDAAFKRLADAFKPKKEQK